MTLVYAHSDAGVRADFVKVISGKQLRSLAAFPGKDRVS